MLAVGHVLVTRRYQKRGEAGIVYVDNDPIMLRHAKALLASPEGVVVYLDADLRDPENILREAAKTLNFGQPMAVLLLGILHNIGDQDDPYGIVRRLIQAIPGGSYLAICHLTADLYPQMAEFARALNERQLDAPLVLRDHAQVTGRSQPSGMTRSRRSAVSRLAWKGCQPGRLSTLPAAMALTSWAWSRSF